MSKKFPVATFDGSLITGRKSACGFLFSLLVSPAVFGNTSTWTTLANYNALSVRNLIGFWSGISPCSTVHCGSSNTHPPTLPNLPLPQTGRVRLSSRPHTRRLQNGRHDGRIQLPTQGKKGDGKLHLSSLILPGGFESAVCFEIACDLMTVARSSVGSYSYSCMCWTRFVFRAAELSWKGMVKVRHF